MRPCPRCQRQPDLTDAVRWGTRCRCECGELFTDNGLPEEVQVPSLGPPPWIPVLPPRPRQRFIFGSHPVMAQLSLTRCDACHATLALDESMLGEAMLLRCGGCGTTRRASKTPPAVFVHLDDLGGAFATAARLGSMDSRFSVPLREPPTRAWLEAAGGQVTPLLGDTSLLARRDGGWFQRDGRPIGSGDLLPGPGMLRFGQSGAFEPPAHFAPLDERPHDRDAWLVWADHLEEQHSPLTRWLSAARRPAIALFDQLGFLAPLVQQGLVFVSWNAFGFCDSVRLHAQTFAAYPFALDATHVPAARYVTEFAVDAPEPGAVDALAKTLLEATLPRALRRLVVRGPEGARARLEGALAAVRRRCPFFSAP